MNSNIYSQKEKENEDNNNIIIKTDILKEGNDQMLITMEKYLELIKLEFMEHLQKYKNLYENVIKKINNIIII